MVPYAIFECTYIVQRSCFHFILHFALDLFTNDNDCIKPRGTCHRKKLFRKRKPFTWNGNPSSNNSRNRDKPERNNKMKHSFVRCFILVLWAFTPMIWRCCHTNTHKYLHSKQIRIQHVHPQAHMHDFLVWWQWNRRITFNIYINDHLPYTCTDRHMFSGKFFPFVPYDYKLAMEYKENTVSCAHKILIWQIRHLCLF